ncbi:hypothetical protein R84B8_03109 [Treponema sp. R8-4-B8]
MVINFRSLFFVLLFLCFINVLFCQEDDAGNKHRIAWTKDDYALRYEVLIEKEENNKYSNFLREFTEEPFIYISLPPGNYRLRVIPYDFRDVPGKGTGWKNFKVLAVTTPDSESEPESQLVMEDPSPSFPEQEEVQTPQQAENKTPKENVTEKITEDADLTKPEKQKDLFVALFAEGVGYSRKNGALGGGIVFGGSLDGKGIGLRLLYAQDAENFIFLEALAHVRFYLSPKKDNTGIFLQAEGGIVFFSYEKFQFTGYLSPVGGISAGWRFMMNKNWYIEPFVRVGYPYIFGAGFSTGFRF